MTAPTEHTSSGPGTPDSPSSDPQTDLVGEALGLHRPRRTVTPEEWRRVRAPFSRDAYVVESRATGRTAANLPLEAYADEEDTNRSVVDLRLRSEAIRDRLDLVLGPGRYAYRFESGPEAGGTFSMFCTLRVGSATRTGVGTGSSPRAAGKVALASAASAFGMGASGEITGPVVAERDSWHQLPTELLEALERRADPSSWTPEGESLFPDAPGRSPGDREELSDREEGSDRPSGEPRAAGG